MDRTRSAESSGRPTAASRFRRCVQGSVHERERRAHRSERSEHRVRGSLAAAEELRRGKWIRRRMPAAFQVHRWWKHLEAARLWTAHGAGGESRDRARRTRRWCTRMVAGAPCAVAAARRTTGGARAVQVTDAGEHWTLAASDDGPIPRPLRASAAAISPRSPSIRRTKCRLQRLDRVLANRMVA